jgi:hypothetical protein
MKRWIPTALLALVAFAMLLHGPIPQLEHYHEFADARALFGLPNAADVLSNVGFALVGLWGFFALRGHRHHPGIEAAWPAYCVFLAAITLTAFGSSFYHLAPDNDRLVWDRLPIALACAGLRCYAETHAPRSPFCRGCGRRWRASRVVFHGSSGIGDLRPYLHAGCAARHSIWPDLPLQRRSRTLALRSSLRPRESRRAEDTHFETLGFMSGHT